jgi:hypothetical protein
MMEPAVGPTILSRQRLWAPGSGNTNHRENINGLRNQATALKMKAAAMSSSLSGKRPYRSLPALHTPRRLGEQNAKLRDLPHGSAARQVLRTAHHGMVSLAAVCYSFRLRPI